MFFPHAFSEHITRRGPPVLLRPLPPTPARRMRTSSQHGFLVSFFPSPSFLLLSQQEVFISLRFRHSSFAEMEASIKGEDCSFFFRCIGFFFPQSAEPMSFSSSSDFSFPFPSCFVLIFPPLHFIFFLCENDVRRRNPIKASPAKQIGLFSKHR